ncbi:MAG: hypothetical protein K1000chlam2_01843 [Chlamydiae bacterium]|nr:hypothetical protein [Chlamydiota bacterium]
MKIGEIGAQIQEKAAQFKAYALKADPKRGYSEASPLNHDMDKWGETPIRGLFTGTARATYGGVKCGLGLTATVLSATLVPLARGVEWVARKALGKPGQSIKIKTCLKASAGFGLNGLGHLLKGLVEMITLGCRFLIIKGYYTAKARLSSDKKLMGMTGRATFSDMAQPIVDKERGRREAKRLQREGLSPVHQDESRCRGR